jgi:hypothetical protein
MKTVVRKCLVVSTVGVAAAIAPYTGASAATFKPTIANVRGPVANAGFETVDGSGCVVTDVFVSANSGVEQDLPTTTHVGVASVSIYRYNACTGDEYINAAGYTDRLPAGAFSVSKQLDRARLVTTIPVDDLTSGTAYDVAVDVTWTGTSVITRDHANTNDRYPACHVLNRWKGSGRTADAMGTVSVGTTNFTPTTSQWGEVGTVISGFEVIGCADAG